MNKVILVGRLTKDANIAFTQSGKKVTKFSVAWQWKKDSDTSFFTVEYWNAPDFMDSLLTKGAEVLIDGSLKQNRWQTDSGENRSTIIVKAQFVKAISMPRNSAPATPQKPEQLSVDELGEAINLDPWGEDEIPY